MKKQKRENSSEKEVSTNVLLYFFSGFASSTLVAQIRSLLESDVISFVRKQTMYGVQKSLEKKLFFIHDIFLTPTT